MNVQTAKTQIAIIDYLASKGYVPVSHNSVDYWYLSPFRNEKTASFKVNSVLNKWFDHGIGQGGNIIDLALKMGCKSVKGALDDISKIQPDIFSFHQHENFDRENKPKCSNITIVKHQAVQNLALIEYAVSRGISEQVLKKYCSETYYRTSITGKMYFSISFSNDIGGYALRNKYFKTATSPSGITTINNRKSRLILFEGFFDFLSYKTLNIENDEDYLVLNSISFIDNAEAKFLNYDLIELYLDNDTASTKLKRILISKYRNVIDKSTTYIDFKDLNEMLVSNMTG